ncbi:vesicular glutamate transporter 2-like [Liolophura sinensis]|uniref:vesicular glutamate transporter 2-like n=1 Tax=Liolophura sinensis TaxID=3198878 RepID=UPI0031590FD4
MGIEDDAGKPLTETDSNLTLTREHADEGKASSWSVLTCRSYFPKRYIVAVMALLGFCNVYALRVNLSVAIVAMTNNRTIRTDNLTVVMLADFDWDSRAQGLVLASFFYGYILTQIPGGYLAKKYGGRRLFGGGILVTALFTLLTPLCASWNIYVLLVVRVIEGLFEGVTYPAIHAVWARWAPPAEKTRLASIAFSGSYLGTVIAFPVCGALASSAAGWPSIFYVFGTVGVVWSLAWWYLITDAPEEHDTISSEELEYLQRSIGFNDQQVKRAEVPWKAILTSVPVWAIVAAHFAENWGFYTWLTLLPTFMNDILGFDLNKAGFLSAVPYFAMAVVVQASGFLADYLRKSAICDTTTVRKVYTCGAFLFQGVFIIAAGYVVSATAAVACITIAVGIGGFALSGFMVNHLDLAPQHASILMGLSNTVATIPGIVSPSLAGGIVRNNSSGEWQIVFYIAAGIYVLGTTIYGIFGAGRQQPWADMSTDYISYT